MNIQTINPVNGAERVADTATQTKVAYPPPPNRPDVVEEITKAEEKVREEKESVLSADDVKELTEQMNEVMDELQTSLGFSIREEMNHLVVIEVKDRNTDELIKQIPSEELLAIKEKMDEFTGLLFDQKA
ncbi:MAG: flagellar protein FlaG [Desulfobacter sp.]|nr:MAG: flagellar protein FlaG [Desulfobacter sp.]